MTVSQSTIDPIVIIALITLIVVRSPMIVAPFVGIIFYGIIISVPAPPIEGSP